MTMLIVVPNCQRNKVVLGRKFAADRLQLEKKKYVVVIQKPQLVKKALKSFQFGGSYLNKSPT